MDIVAELQQKVYTRGFAYLVGAFTAHMKEVVSALNVSYWAEPGSNAAGFQGQVVAEAQKWLLAHGILPEKVREILA